MYSLSMLISDTKQKMAKNRDIVLITGKYLIDLFIIPNKKKVVKPLKKKKLQDVVMIVSCS